MVKKLLVSGYKSHEINIYNDNDPKAQVIKGLLQKRLFYYVEQGVEWIITSGQPGIETWVVEMALDLQEYVPVKIAVFPPYAEHYENWKEEKKEHFLMLMDMVDFFQPISNKKYEGPWQLKNKNAFLIEKTDGMLLFYDYERPGSPQFLYNEATKANDERAYHIDVIDFYELQCFYDELMENVQYEEEM